MKYKYFLNTLVVFALVFSAGCAQKNDNENDNQFNLLHIKILSDELKISASGVLKKDKDGVQIAAYSGAQPVAKIKADTRRVCVNEKCAKNLLFNSRFFGLKSSDAIMLKLLKFQRLDGVFKQTCNEGERCYFNAFIKQVFGENSLLFKSKKSKIILKKLQAN